MTNVIRMLTLGVLLAAGPAVLEGQDTGDGWGPARAGLAAQARGSGTAVSGGASAGLDRNVPEAWLQEDPGDSLYRAGRRALNDAEYRRAAALFAELTERYPESGYMTEALYFQAFALYRAESLTESLAVLDRLAREYPEAPNLDESVRLRVRVESAMARRGDAGSRRRLAEQAERPSGPCSGQDYEIRAMALSALINMDSDRAMPILREVLENRDDCAELRKQAVFLVSQHGGEEVVDLMLDLAHRNPDPDPEVRGQAVFWLSQVDAPEAVDALQSILETSDDTQLQEQALFALSQHDDDRAVDILRRFVRRTDVPEDLRANAIFHLAQRDDMGADFLIPLWDEVESRRLKEQILFAMSQTDDPRAHGWLMDAARDETLDIELRKNALFWAVQSDDVDVDALMDMYRSMESNEMREQILFGLSQMDEPAAVDALMEIARSDSDSELRERAIFWLGQSDDPRVADFLLELIRR